MYCKLPNKAARLTLLEKFFEQVNHVLNKEDFEFLANSTEGFTCLDIKKLADSAATLRIDILSKYTHFYLGKDKLFHASNASCSQAIEINIGELPQTIIAGLEFTRVNKKLQNEL